MTEPLAAPAPTLFKLASDALTHDTTDALRHGAVFARVEAGVIEVVGPGAVQCVQGLLTNDLDPPGGGDGAFVYGALLTPKGMIVTDGWAARLGTSIGVVVPPEGRQAALATFQRSLPPRLARYADRSEDLAVVRIAGPRALGIAAAAGLPVPAHPGRVAAVDGDVTIARPGDGAPFAAQIIAPAHHMPRLRERLGVAGAVAARPPVLELARILAGWPRLGAEVDGKTLPQEVRFDEIGGVSYTKGCYVGQETVARVHFRGHPNRALMGLELDGEPDAPGDVLQDDKVVGRLTSAACLPGGAWIGLGVLRREVEVGASVIAGGKTALLVQLPFNTR